jgi:hypothetical protein
MTTPTTLYPAASTIVKVGGAPTIALYGPLVGGLITNPARASDQGIPTVEVLYVDLIGPAALAETGTTFALAPGESFAIPPGQTSSVSVNAATGGHTFSAIAYQPSNARIPSNATFPPSGPTSVSKTIPAYLYQEYADDDDLQSFFAAYNEIAQEFVDWFNAISLPVYTGPLISGALLDWVAAGLYGMTRPSLPTGSSRNAGPLNTYELNTLALNELTREDDEEFFATSDDTFKRILTWHLYKGDGKVFNVRWLKRRVLRFLLGVNGTDVDVSDTSRISVSFGVGNQVDIGIVPGVRTVVGGAIPNFGILNGFAMNELDTAFVAYPSIPEAVILKAAIDDGVLELPFQFDYVVTVS